MTCIAGLVGKDGKVYIGADTAVSNSGSGSTASIKGSKIIELGNYLLGVSGSPRLASLSKKFPDPGQKDDNISLTDHLANKWIDGVRAVLKDHGFTEINNNAESAGTFMIGGFGELCVVSNDFGITQLKRGFDAIGSGMFLAEGVLIYTQKYNQNLKPETRVLRALEVSAEGNAFVGAPFTILTI